MLPLCLQQSNYLPMQSIQMATFSLLYMGKSLYTINFAWLEGCRGPSGLVCFCAIRDASDALIS